ncbi:C39 family peptidase [Leptolyngbya sp. PCC 6406]|uniref:C39 family peptidase n=1 Tax=Leptolyngbya sp. PCC 6406 TaxID=1173264 RepID=UPI0002AC08E3|nr:C39 family peptidase [Leptolyngbya sp. PCC 6406]
MVATITGVSFLITVLYDCKETIGKINRTCAEKGLPPAFYVLQDSKLISGNTDYCFQGFGINIDSVLPPKLSLTFWVHYLIDSAAHVSLGKFACPLKVLDTSAFEMLRSLERVPFADLQFNEASDDLGDLPFLGQPSESAEQSTDVDLEVESDLDQPGYFEESFVEAERIPDPENFTLRALQNTVLKISSIPSPELSDDEKVNFSAQSTVPLVSFEDSKDHLKVTLANTTLGGRKTWVAYREHVEILKPDGTRLVGQYRVGDALPKQVNLSVPWYSQRDNKYHPSSTCNVTCVAMILAYFGVRPKSDVQLEDQLYLEVTEGGRNHGDRLLHEQLSQLMKDYGLSTKFSTQTSWQEIKTHLANGNPVIMSGYFTSSGHIIVLRGYDETGFWVNDPWGEWFTNGYQNKSGENLHYSYALCRRCSRSNDVTWAHLPADPKRTYQLPVLTQANTVPTEVPVASSLTPAELSKRASQAIVNVFETGNALGDYSSVVCHRHDLGGLTYGRSQTTINSGNLYLLVKAYCEADGAAFADELLPYLEKLAKKSATLKCDSGSSDLREITVILRKAGTDPVMRSTQDNFFDRAYWTPAVNAARNIGIQTALGKAVVYDSFIHGSWGAMRDRTNQSHGTVSQIGEKAWVQAYIKTRRHWLGNHSNPLLRNTVYRMDAFNQLIQVSNWDLVLPFSVRGCRIDQAVMEKGGHGRAEPSSFRILRLVAPHMSGEDVRRVQQALKDKGYFSPEETIDGIFGPNTERKVKAFQQNHQLRVDGIIGLQTWNALGL